MDKNHYFCKIGYPLADKQTEPGVGISMKITFLLLLFLSGFCVSAQTVLWSEDFEGESNNATTGTAAGTIGGTWRVMSLPPNGAGSFSKQGTGGNRFTVNGTGNGEGVWSSGVINISSAPEVAIDMTLVEFLSSNAQDYLRVYYKLNNGPEVLFGSIEGGGGYDVEANASVILSGNTLELIVRGRENTGNYLFVIPTFLRFDDVNIIQIDRLYSRAAGNWNTGTTWTKDPATNVSCGCTPNAGTHVVIRHNVAMNTSGDAIDVTVNSGGTLRYTGDNTLRIHRGGSITINSGGSINRNNFNGSRIEFAWTGATNNVTINGASSIGVINIPVAARVNFSGSSALSVSDDILISSAAVVDFGGTGSIAISDDLQISSNATITFSGTGNFTVGDDMIVTAAAVINNNKTGGSVTINDDLNLDTDNATIINNHLLSANDLVSGDGDDGNVLRNNSGATFNVVTIAPGNGNLTIDNFGTINQSGNFTNGSLDTGSTFTNRSTGVWNFSAVGGTNDGDINSVLKCSEAGNTFNYNGGGNQSVINTPYHHLGILGSGTKTLGGTTDINGNLTIANSTLTGNNNNISLAGNWSVTSGNFNQGTGILTFDGSANQTVSNGAGQTFTRLVINKPSGAVVLNNNVTIANGQDPDLTLTRGNVNSSASAMFILNDDVTVSGGSANSFINGPVRKIGNDTFIFPTGKNGRYARIRIVPAGATTTSQFTAEYFNTPHANLAVDGSLKHVSHAEYWTLTRAVNSPTATVTLYWEDSFSDISNLADLRVARYTGTLWTLAGGAGGTGSPSGPGTVSSTSGISNFQAFTFASLSGINILPVELLYFKATLKNNEVELQWETASEVNNDYFTIERTSDAETFFPIKDIEGQGETRQRTKYSFTDTNPLYGRSYYRLKQTDLDGSVTYSDLTFVDFEGPRFPTLSVYPNPSIGRTVTLKLEGFKDAKIIPVQILDSRGILVFETLVEIPGHSAYTTELNLTLPQGIYFIRAGSTRFLNQRIVVK